MIKLMTFFFACLLATTAKPAVRYHMLEKTFISEVLKAARNRRPNPTTHQFLSSSTFMKLGSLAYYSAVALLHCILVVTEQLSTLTFTHGTFVDECILRD